ncbi:hypothetical protein ES703_117851 [subsurface metagenome]
MSPLLDYTTSVPVSRTIAQIQAKLVEHGAREVSMKYDDQRRIIALAFIVVTPNVELPIRLPIDAKATLRVLEKQYYNREIPHRYVNEAHAYRVAWRIIKDWVEAQMSLLETEMVKMEQIFLPYVITPGGQTVYEVVAQKRFLLGPGEGGKGE